MKKNGKHIALLFGLALSAGVPLAAHAQAQALGGYAGVGGGQSEAQKYACALRPACKKKGSAYKLFAGWQFHRNFAVEVGYTDLGHVSSSDPGASFDETVKTGMSEATLVGFIHGSDRVSLFGKVGAYYAHTTHTVTQSGTTQETKKGNGNPTIGAGLQYFFTSNIAVRAEGQKYFKVDDQLTQKDDWTAYTIGVLWKFR